MLSVLAIAVQDNVPAQADISRPFLDLSTLTPVQIGLITAGATLCAAVMAATGALVVAFVNARAARQLDAARAKREYYQRVLEHYFARLDEEIVLCSKLVAFLTHSGGANPKDIDRARFEALFEPFRDSRVLDSTSTAVQALSLRDDFAKGSFENVRMARENLVDSTHAVVYLLRDGDQSRWQVDKLTNMREQAQQFVTCATHFREYLEAWVFGEV